MAHSKKTILVVEDSPVQMLSVLNLLQMEGVNVLCARDGRIGLALALQNRPDAIVLDIEMPVKDGLEVCAALKEDARTADIPVIMLTAHQDTSSIRRSLGSGAVDFIPKDAFAPTVLLETLRQLHVLPELETSNLEARHD